ncbi:MAG: hypothetical protein Q9169_007341 [Polycauliona sp. 2 TL-2023]
MVHFTRYIHDVVVYGWRVFFVYSVQTFLVAMYVGATDPSGDMKPEVLDVLYWTQQFGFVVQAPIFDYALRMAVGWISKLWYVQDSSWHASNMIYLRSILGHWLRGIPENYPSEDPLRIAAIPEHYPLETPSRMVAIPVSDTARELLVTLPLEDCSSVANETENGSGRAFAAILPTWLFNWLGVQQYHPIMDTALSPPPISMTDQSQDCVTPNCTSSHSALEVAKRHKSDSLGHIAVQGKDVRSRSSSVDCEATCCTSIVRYVDPMEDQDLAQSEDDFNQNAADSEDNSEHNELDDPNLADDEGDSDQNMLDDPNLADDQDLGSDKSSTASEGTDETDTYEPGDPNDP